VFASYRNEPGGHSSRQLDGSSNLPLLVKFAPWTRAVQGVHRVHLSADDQKLPTGHADRGHHRHTFEALAGKNSAAAEHEDSQAALIAKAWRGRREPFANVGHDGHAMHIWARHANPVASGCVTETRCSGSCSLHRSGQSFPNSAASASYVPLRRCEKSDTEHCANTACCDSEHARKR
jgi:hypothetical protein